MRRDDVRNNLYLAGLVKRYHTWPTLHQETVAEHTFGVLQVYRQIWGLTPGVVECILDHDLPEIRTGDAPFPAKRECPELAAGHKAAEKVARVEMGVPNEKSYDVHDHERVRMKIADLLQMWLFGRHESRLGSAYAIPIVNDTSSAALELAQSLSQVDSVSVRTWMNIQIREEITRE